MFYCTIIFKKKKKVLKKILFLYSFYTKLKEVQKIRPQSNEKKKKNSQTFVSFFFFVSADFKFIEELILLRFKLYDYYFSLWLA